jgi:hypothetical protein
MLNSLGGTEVDVVFSINFYTSRSLGDTYLMTLDAIVQLQYEGLCFHSSCSCDFISPEGSDDSGCRERQ